MPLGLIGKYEKLDVLGSGVSGIVYLAKDTLLNKQVALKEVDVQAGDLRRFLEEARVMDRLRHPNIVRVNNVDRIEGKVVIDMEYVRGQNLQELLRAEGPLPIGRSLDIVAQVLDALHYAHQMQTVHRDIKPANILIGRDGQVKLVDFGLAEILATNAYAGGAGTYAYMAPEDFAEDDRSDSQSDIWAVGVTLYEMLTHQRPFTVAKVKDPFAWKRVLETESPTPLSDYLPDAPPMLQAILERALARDKQQRYPTAGEFRDDLIRFQQGQQVASQTLRQAHARRNPLLRRGSNPPGAPASSPSGSGLNTPPIPLSSTDQPLPWWEKEEEEMRRQGEKETQSTKDVSFSPHSLSPPLLSNPIGRIVAEVNASITNNAQPSGTSTERKARLPFARRDSTARLSVEPGRVDFGAVRKGEMPSVKITARVTGGDGVVEGRVVHSSDWLTVHPPAINRAKQSLTLTAHSSRVWETGEFHETVRIETNAGTVEVPTRLIVLPPRASFMQIALWFAPLFGAAMLPVLAIAFASGGSLHHAELVARYTPGAAVASAGLGLMLLLVSIAADIGIAERIACGVLIAVMGATLGMSSGHVSDGSTHQTAVANTHQIAVANAHRLGMENAVVLAGFMVGILLLQLLHLRKWKLWAFIIAALGLAVGGALLQILQ